MDRRNTVQKEAVLSVIQGKNKHMTAEEVLMAVKDKYPSIGQATVYRNLNLLCNQGMISRIIDKGQCFYDGNATPHYHLHCPMCGRFYDLDLPYDETLDKKMSKELGVEIEGHKITFEGVCRECNKNRIN